MELLKYQQQVHQNSKSKGFWEQKENRSRGEMVALIVSELSEAIEAHRINHTASAEILQALEEEDLTHRFVDVFKTTAKNTIGDEMADTVIRILDYCEGWGIPIYPRDYRKASTGNFAHDILRLQHYAICAFHENPAKDWGYLLAAIEAFCRWYSIDLPRHVELKMRYNATRPYKHNKAY